MTKKLELIEKQLVDIKAKICQKIDSYDLAQSMLNISIKEDRTPITEIDIYISNLFREFISLNMPEVNFYSEEDLGQRQFPVCILDPIDGTRELIANNGECAVSFGVYYSDDFLDDRNFSWIYNPFTGFEISSKSIYSAGAVRAPLGKPLCYVSRSEFRGGLFQDKLSDLNITALGSIALKLGLLSAGSCDAVISLRNKNIWDIAAGIHIFISRGGQCYEGRSLIQKIEFKIYQSPLTFTYEQLATDILSELKVNK